ncbi:MAG: hypothetical protein KBT06_03750, partial [Prevotellaceae bacterium]|nr:hypothetical protein [Candidatus Colivivens equi]
MELTSKFKKAIALSKSYVQSTTDKALNNQQIKSIADRSVDLYHSAVNGALNMMDSINKELNTSVYETKKDTISTNVVESTKVLQISDRQKKIVKYIDKVEKQRNEVNNTAANILSGKCKTVHITAHLLAKKFKVHPRTVQRDLSI